jgi:hypothetical protein
MPGNIVLPGVLGNEQTTVPIDDDSNWVTSYLEKAKVEYSKMRTSFFDKEATDFYSFYLHSNLRKGERLIPAVDAVTLYNISSRVIVSASGGLGKSTLMRHLLLSAIEMYSRLRLFPLFVRLGDYTHSDTTEVLDFLLEQADVFGAEVKRSGLFPCLKTAVAFCSLMGWMRFRQTI